MLTIKCKVMKSKLGGKGLFSMEFLPKGKMVGILAQEAMVMSEDKYQKEQKKGNYLVIMTAVRWVGNLFLYGDKITKEEFINHSESPTMLYHLGVCFALRDIQKGEELTVNYNYFLAEEDVNRFESIEKKGKIVDGISPKNALINSAKELIKLFQDPKANL
jgi:SET domain-containing protein